VLEPELIEHLESDATLLVGTVDADGVPDATYGWGFQVLDACADAPRVRVLVPEAAARTRANLETTGRVAATVTDVVTLASAQVKGRVVGIEPVTAADGRRVTRQFDAVAQKIHETDGTAMEVIGRFRPGPLFAVTLTVEEVYDQTPGPVAGVRLAPTTP
jgi:predicted pyridoxine 5'-phosphate oxidase superfamily flavin-nucleotide-binding protein